MSNSVRLKEPYIIAGCCTPSQDDVIVGYYSHESQIKVHKSDCPNLSKAPQDRLMMLKWSDILDDAAFSPDCDYKDLTAIDFKVMKHHREFGVDYSLKMARMMHEDKQAVFDCHTKLRSLKILERVKPLIIQYRKGIVDNKWIKHRNHTYYDLTEKGNKYLDYHTKNQNN